MCGKSRSELEMRPLVNVDELKAGNIIGECKEEGEREIGDGQVNVVCRYCWLDLLGTKTKEEIIEIFETICGLLFEIDRRYKEEKKQTLQIGGGSIEWGSGDQYTLPLTAPINPTIWKTGTNDNTFTINSTATELFTTGSSSSNITFDAGNISISGGTLTNLGNQWEELTDEPDNEEE
jgi:hypothetical protein